MIRINLLPIRQIKQRNRSRQEVMALASAFVVLLIVIGLVGYRQASRVGELQAETARLQQEKAKFQTVIAQIEKIKKEQKVLEEKMAVIKSLKIASQLPARVLDEIANLTPSDRMWLTSLNYSNNLLMISGTALDNATIAEYMNRVARSDYFMAAELKNSSLVKVGNQKLKSFSMTINVLAAPTPVVAQNAKKPVAKK
jgi:type IV pilus assembly protein PilN